MTQDLKKLPERFFGLLVVAAGMIVYASSFSGVFVFDDIPRIVENSRIQHFWPFHAFWIDSDRPTVELTLALNYAVGRLAVGGYHAFNLGIHLLAALALFGIVRRTLESSRLKGRYGQAAPWLALTIALIWTVHPLQTQSVIYIIQRAELLMGLFYLLTLYCSLRAMSAPWPGRWKMAAVLSCALGMGSKAVMMTVPLMVFLYDRTFHFATIPEALRARGKFYLGLAATGLVLVRPLVIRLAAEVQSAGFTVYGVTPMEYALTQPSVLLHYLRLAFWPHPLVIDYAWQVEQSSATIGSSAVAIAALALGTLWGCFRRSGISFLGVWFFVILAPTSSFIPLLDLAVEHRMYLPLAAVIAFVVVGGWNLLDRFVSSESLRRAVAIGLVVVLVVSLSALTIRRNADYRSIVSVWADTVAKRPNNPRAHRFLGHALKDQGRVDGAIIHFQKALELKKDYAAVYNDLGKMTALRGAFEEAADYFSQALHFREGFPEARSNLGTALAKQGRFSEAIAHYQEALWLRPDFFDAYVNLGNTLLASGRESEAMDHYRIALGLNLGSHAVRQQLEALVTQSGDSEVSVPP